MTNKTRRVISRIVIALVFWVAFIGVMGIVGNQEVEAFKLEQSEGVLR